MKKLKLIPLEEVLKKMKFSAEEEKEIQKDVKYHRIAYYIREIRLKEKLTQEQLAKKAGIPRTVISRIESGRSNITLDTLINLADSMDRKVRIEFVKKD